MNVLRALAAVIAALELAVLVALRVRAELDRPWSALLTVAICMVLANLVIILLRPAPRWLVWIAIFALGLPIVFGWLFLSILTGIAGT